MLLLFNAAFTDDIQLIRRAFCVLWSYRSECLAWPQIQGTATSHGFISRAGIIIKVFAYAKFPAIPHATRRRKLEYLRFSCATIRLRYGNYFHDQS